MSSPANPTERAIEISDDGSQEPEQPAKSQTKRVIEISDDDFDVPTQLETSKLKRAIEISTAKFRTPYKATEKKVGPEPFCVNRNWPPMRRHVYTIIVPFEEPTTDQFVTQKRQTNTHHHRRSHFGGCVEFHTEAGLLSYYFLFFRPQIEHTQTVAQILPVYNLDPEIIGAALHWMKTGKIQLYHALTKEYRDCDMRRVLEVYMLAEKWEMPALQRDALNRIYCLMDTSVLIANATRIYDGTDRDSALRHLVLEILLDNWEFNVEDYAPDAIPEALLRDLIVALRRQGRVPGKSRWKPTKWFEYMNERFCREFHNHPPDEFKTKHTGFTASNQC